MSFVPSAGTRLVALLGDPVAHSISPQIHNAAFREQSLKLVYLAFRVRQEALSAALDGLHALGAVGANVTRPHKEAAHALAVEHSEAAKVTGAANTLVRTKQGWRADNTDVEGFMQPLRPREAQLEDADAVILGAGGAARGVAYGLCTLGLRTVTVVSRRINQAASLCKDLEPWAMGTELVPRKFDWDLKPLIRSSRLLVNATPLGTDDLTVTPWPDADAFHEGLIIYDLVYTPKETNLMRSAASRGATVIGGLPMLIAQAAASYRQWTRVEMDTDAAYAAAKLVLGDDEP